MEKLSSINVPKVRVSVRVIAVLLAIIAGVLFWYMTQKVIPPIEAETASLETQIASLDAQEKELTKMYEDMDFYLDETTRLNEETEDILTEFPTFMYLEDKILYADTLLKTDLYGYNIHEFMYGQSNFKMSVVFGDQSSVMELYEVALSASFNDLTYVQIKELLDYGLSSSQRFVVNGMSVGYNEETGYISGDFTFKTYFIPGQSTPYEFPPEVIEALGNSDRVDDLFGSRKNPVVVD